VSAQKDGIPTGGALPLVTGQPVNGLIQPATGPQLFTFANTTSETLLLSVTSDVGAVGLDVIVRATLSRSRCWRKAVQLSMGCNCVFRAEI
jgi:hypothetical protein